MDKLTHFLKSTLQRAQSLLAQLSARLRCILLCIKRVFKRLIIRLRRLYRKIKGFLMRFPLGIRAAMLGAGGLIVAAVLIVIIVAVAAPKPTPIVADLAPGEQSTPIPLATSYAEPSVESVETPAPHPLGGKVLEKGDSGELVETVQIRLMELGYLDSDEPTDYFGSMTKEALSTFQRHHGIKDDGVLGENTYNYLFSFDAKVYVMQKGDEGDEVSEVQERLYQLGYLKKNAVDGEFGTGTEAAVMAFQSANKLTSDGKVGEKTFEMLSDEHVVSNSFKSGDTDPSIEEYQQRLVKLGYLDKDYKAQGRMDSKTVAAIKDFQEANGLTRDGCLGPATMDALNSNKALGKAIRLGSSGLDVKKLQERLYKLGYLKSSSITSYFGEKTQAAVMSFQKRNNLSEDGAVGTKTSAKLFSDSAKKAPQEATPKPEKSQKPSKSSSPSKSQKPEKTSSGSTITYGKGVETFIDIAMSKKGCKYVRGAKGPNTFDCSGFVYWCMNQAGVKQSYMNSVAWRSCTKYKRITKMGDLKRGDVLVFYGATKTGKGHVGIYLGNNKMIDAGSSKGAVVIRDSIQTNYWKTHFAMAYRIWD